MTPSLGVVIGLPIAALILAVCVVLIVVAVRRYQWSPGEFEAEGALFLGAGAAAAALLVLVVTGFTMWPWKAEYHEWRTASGTVAQVDSRTVSDGDHGMTERFVVTYTDRRQRACDDTRCAAVRPGDRLTLRCKRAYQWSGTPGWDCNWLRNEEGAR